MREYRTVLVDGIKHTVLISDEQEALLAAQAAGRAVLGLWDPKKPQDAPWGIPFLAEKEVPVDPDFLERAVRRQKGLPWMISRTKRLTLREFQESDWDGAAEFQKEKDCPEAFSGREAFRAYIRNQYGFYQYGIWAVIENETGSLAGAAGVWDMPDKPAFLSCSEGDRDSFLELGYWIRRPFPDARVGPGSGCCGCSICSGKSHGGSVCPDPKGESFLQEAGRKPGILFPSGAGSFGT